MIYPQFTKLALKFKSKMRRRGLKTATMRRMSYEEGLELYHDIGVEEGKNEERDTIIKNMLKAEIPKETIAISVGISVEELNHLLAS